MKIGQIRGTEIHVHGSMILMAIGSVWLGCIEEWAVLSLVLALHELGHGLAARLFGSRIESMQWLPVGATLHLAADRPLSPGRSACVALAGPVVNLWLALAAGFAMACFSWNCTGFMEKNLIMMAVNLLPAWPLDGGRILQAVLEARWGHGTAVRGMTVCGALFASASAAVFILLGIRGIWNFSFLFLCGFLILGIVQERRGSTYGYIQELTRKQGQLSAQRMLLIRPVAADFRLPIGAVIRGFTPYRLHTVTVIGPDLYPMGTLGEPALMEALMRLGPEAPIGEALCLRVDRPERF